MHFPYSVKSDFPLFLAPMAGVSESPFRQICRRYGADVVVSEFISAVGISLGIERVLAEMRFEPVERPIGIQIYGADAGTMATAAGMVTELFGRLGYDHTKVKLILNRYQKSSKITLEVVAETLKVPVSHAISNDFVSVIDAINRGLLLREAAPTDKQAQESRKKSTSHFAVKRQARRH